MTGRPKSPFPRDIDVPVRFLDRFTLQDVIRFAVCVGSGGIVGGAPGAVTGALIGTTLVFFTPYGSHLDNLCKNLIVDWLRERDNSLSRVDSANRSEVVLDNGSVVGVVSINSCSLEMVSEEEQRANRAVLKDLVDTANFPFEIRSLQLNADLSEFTGSLDTGTLTFHFAVVRAVPERKRFQDLTASQDKETQSLEDVVDNRCEAVVTELNNGDFDAERVYGRELGFIVENIQARDIEPSWNGYGVENGDKCRQHRMVYISNYPREVSLGWLSDVLNTEGLVDIVQTVEPVTDKQRKQLSRTVGKLQLELSSSSDPSNLTELQRAKQDAEDLLDIEAGGDSLINYGVYIVAKDSSEKTASQALTDVKRSLRSHRVEFEEPVFRAWGAALTESDVGPNRLEESLIVPGESVAAGFPFSTYDTIDSDGIVFGTDTRNRMPVVLDRFSWDAPHIVRMGMTGSGKTVGTMLEIVRSYRNYTDLHIRIVDPKPDYSRIIEALNGETIVIDDADLDTVSPPTVARYVLKRPEEDNTGKLAAAVQAIHREACNNGTKTIVVVDEAHRLLNDPTGCSALSTLIREGRSHSVGVTILTQNSDDLTQSTQGRNILRNTGCYLFMRHQDVDHSAIEFFDLSESESVQLRKLATGNKNNLSEAVIRGPINSKIRIRVESDEGDAVFSEEK